MFYVKSLKKIKLFYNWVTFSIKVFVIKAKTSQNKKLRL